MSPPPYRRKHDPLMLLGLIEIRLEAIGHNKYPSDSMARQAALDALEDLEELKHVLSQPTA